MNLLVWSLCAAVLSLLFPDASWWRRAVALVVVVMATALTLKDEK